MIVVASVLVIALIVTVFDDASTSTVRVRPNVTKVPPSERSLPTRAGATTAPTGTRVAPTTKTTAVVSKPPSQKPSDARRMRLFTTLSGDMSPKSVRASGFGHVTAQNMMYTHTISVFRSDGSAVTTISDRVDLGKLGDPDHTGKFNGAPVEAVFTPDGRYEYVSNYAMYGPGFGPEGTDSCTPASGYDDSYVYRIDTKTWTIDQAIRVGSVPKYMAITPNGRTLLVANWCSFTLSIIDVASARQVGEVSLGRHPRGIAVTRDSATAYVAIMGSSTITKIDLASRTTTALNAGGTGPRHLVLSPDDRWLYVTLNGSGLVAKIDTTTSRVVQTVRTGSAPRSMDISTDGRSLYVVNYNSNTMTKLRTDTMAELQTIKTSHHPIGITYDATTGRVWVAAYVGVISVFDDE